MKAVILAAGKGTRMKELTQEVPKPMLPVQGRPILEHILGGLLSAGIRDVFIVTGHRAETIEAHFGDGSSFGARIAYGRQVVQDGTGKAPELAKAFVGTDNFLLTYGDILVKPETYGQMARRFAEGNFSGLLTVTQGEDVTKGGINFFDEQFCLAKLVEKPSPAQLDELLALQRKHGFALMEDCCAAHGSRFDGKKVGTFGRLSSFSFFYGHHMSTIEADRKSTRLNSSHRT